VPIVNVTQPAAGRFLLSGELNRNTVNSCWRNSISDLLNSSKGETPVIDFAGISQADTAGLAWLLNLLRDANKQNISFTLDNVPETIINLAKISDVDGFLPVQ
jgi:phospholipid transport system transporter-binding protein